MVHEDYDIRHELDAVEATTADHHARAEPHGVVKAVATSTPVWWPRRSVA